MRKPTGSKCIVLTGDVGNVPAPGFNAVLRRHFPKAGEAMNGN